jgi:hypothetical protein
MKQITQKKLPTVDQLVSEEQRNTLEAQAVAMADATRTALVKTNGDLRLEKVKANTKTGEREIVRAQNGKFVKAATLAAALDAKESQAFLREIDPDEGMSRKQAIRNALYKAALKPTEKSLGSCVKVAEFFENESGNTLAKERVLADQTQETNPIRIVMVNMPVLMNPEVLDGDKPQERPKAPSFADSEVIQQNGPSGMPR